MENGHLAYELAGTNHHHLMCTSCGEEIEFLAVSLDAIYAGLESSSGYILNHNHPTLTGLCPKCQRHQSRKKAP